MSSSFTHKHNTDNVLIRSIIVGLLNDLNDKVYIENTNELDADGENKRVPVPFFYSYSSDERFMQDYFQEWADCVVGWIEGNYDPIPRGSLVISSMGIQNAQQTSRFVRGFYLKEEQGELKQYNSYLNSIPMTMSFDVEVMVDTSLDGFKVTQSLIREIYKVLTFNVNFEGVMIPCQAGFSDTLSVDKLMDYTYGENNRLLVKFTLETEFYFPIFDPKQEMFAGDAIAYNRVNFEMGMTATGATPTGYPHGVETPTIEDNETIPPPTETPVRKDDDVNIKYRPGYYEDKQKDTT